VRAVTREALPGVVAIDALADWAALDRLGRHPGRVGLRGLVAGEALRGRTGVGHRDGVAVVLDESRLGTVAALAGHAGVAGAGELGEGPRVAGSAGLGAEARLVAAGALHRAAFDGLVAPDAARVERGAAVTGFARRRLRLPDVRARGVALAAGLHR
jgi:hypothetical protein